MKPAIVVFKKIIVCCIVASVCVAFMLPMSASSRSLSQIDAKINIYVLMPEDAYACKTDTKADMAYVAAEQEFVAYTEENEKFFVKTVESLKNIENCNEEITVTFLDINIDKNSGTVKNAFQGFNIQEGNICVEGIFTENGKEVTRRTVIRFTDIYTLSDPEGFVEILQSDYGYMYQMQGYTPFNGYGYTISENKIETAVSSAIYRVTLAETPVFLVPESYTNSAKVKEALQELLEINNYELEYKEGSLAEILSVENHKKYAGVILADCKSDITTADSDALDKFLENGGKKEKSLFYFAGTNAHDLVGLCDFLKNWGVGFDPGILYETDEGFHAKNEPTKIALDIYENDYTPTALNLDGYYCADNLTYMKQLWQTNNDFTHTRETDAILCTASFGQTAVMPSYAFVDAWTPSADAVLDKFHVALLTQDSIEVENKTLSSYVAVFASADIISADWKQNSVGNFNVVLDLFGLSKLDSDGMVKLSTSAEDKNSASEDERSSNRDKSEKFFNGDVVSIVIAAGIAVAVVCGAVIVIVMIRRKRK